MEKSLLVILAFVAYAEASAVNLILTDGAQGSIVVDAVVARIEKTCIFPDDKRFIRRLAFVETVDGTDIAEFNDGKNGGIWKIDMAMFSVLNSAILSDLRNEIASEFNIDWTTVDYADLSKPLYSGLAASLYSEYVVNSNSKLLEIPRSVSDQSVFWASYYRAGSDASVFDDKATDLEDSRASCNVGADIVFIIDESGSIGSANYVTEKDFVVKVIESLVIGADSNQVGVITYSSLSDLDIKLDQYTDRAALVDAVKLLAYRGGGTATDSALAQLTDVAFAPGNGARPKDQGHPRVAIVLTDGGSNSKTNTQIEAARAKDAGINLFSVGVGLYVHMPELEGIASEPTCLYYSQLNAGFAEILDLVSSISATTCSVPVPVESNGTLVKPVEGGVPYNCEITVPPKGTSVVLSTTQGNVTLFLSNTTYPSLAFYDAKISVKLGSTASVYIPPGASNSSDATVYCSILSEVKSNVTVVTKPGRITFNCSANRNPCTEENINDGKTYFPHDSPNKYVQCAGIGWCFDRDCPAGLVWDKENLLCNYSSEPTNPDPSNPDPSNPDPSNPAQEYSCANGPDPCTAENLNQGNFYFPGATPSQYVQCGGVGQCHDMSCPAGLVWDTAALACDWPSAPEPTTTPSPSQGYSCANGPDPCTAENVNQGNIYFPGTTPSQFVYCVGVAQCTDRSCPAGLVFDMKNSVCNWPSTPAPSPTSPPLGSTCPSPNPCSMENTAANGYYFPHVDATKFIQCDAHGNCYEMNCRPGTEWNNAIKTCDHASAGPVIEF